MTARWRAIPGYPGYRVSDDGRVEGPRCIVKPEPRNGYLRVRMKREDGLFKWRPVHLLVLVVYVGAKPFPKAEGAHCNGKVQDNRVGNLTWSTRLENENHKRKVGTQPKGGLKEAVSSQVKSWVVRDSERGDSQTLLSKAYGLHRRTIARILAEANTPRFTILTG